jgi:hypothetical protein
VARPFSDDSRYDSIVDNGRKRCLVQVKYAAQVCRPGVYVVRAARQEHSGNRRAPKTMEYLEGEIVFRAVFLAPEKRWYILPFSALRGGKFDVACKRRRSRWRVSGELGFVAGVMP